MGGRLALDDEKAIIARIRESLRAPLADAPVAAASQRPRGAADTSDVAIESELEQMSGDADVIDVEAASYRRVIGRALTFARRVARKVLAPSLERQVSYNLANHRLVAALHAELERLKVEQQGLRRRCDALQTELDALRANTGPR